MFDFDRALYLRGLSLFHVFLPLVMVLLLCRLGYGRRALLAQTLLTWIVRVVTYLVTDPADDINLVFRLGEAPQTRIQPRLYLAPEMMLLPLAVCLPAPSGLETNLRGSRIGAARAVEPGRAAHAHEMWGLRKPLVRTDQQEAPRR
jgi:hypothetical protein